MMDVVWIGLGYAIGAMPFSYWLARLILHADIRLVGDGNPGATNAWKAGGWPVGLPALLLDYLKGVAPVGLAHYAFGVSGWALVPVGLAPMLGHAFSPFLHFRGGKALAVTFGIWTGLTLGEVPMVLGVFLALFLLLLNANAWAVMLGMLGLLAYLLFRRADTPLLAMWAGNLTVLAWKHRRELRQPLWPPRWLLNGRRPNRD
jgi:glycerol-3-phosphate acyltransferase PlsY